LRGGLGLFSEDFHNGLKSKPDEKKEEKNENKRREIENQKYVYV
jgi:hypothetical protein